MLVYANHFQFHGADAEDAIFKGIGGWLKEQLGFGLHPDQLRKAGEFSGYKGDSRCWLRIHVTAEEYPKLYAWVLKNEDATVFGRQWITEIGVKEIDGHIDVSCVVKTDELSTLVAQSPVIASRPRVIGYIVNNVKQAASASFSSSVNAVEMKSVGTSIEYRALNSDIERSDRNYALIIVSPTRDGEYLLDAHELQQRLVGIGQVVQARPDFNSYEMADELGDNRSAWNGAVNVLYAPSLAGRIRNRLFLSDEIVTWGEGRNERISHILSWVTNGTNVGKLRQHIRPEGVAQLSLLRRMQSARENRGNMDASQLRTELEAATTQATQQENYFNTLVEENAALEGQLSVFKSDLVEARSEANRQKYEIESLKNRLDQANGNRSEGGNPAALVDMALRDAPLLPLECLDLIEKAYGENCIILGSAKDSARDMSRFGKGHELLGLLKKLVTTYRSKLLNGGDSQARAVFGQNEFAARESETVMGNKDMKRRRTFAYNGEDVEMFRHLKIGVDDDVTKTIRVHFHWDSDSQKVVIGYCGKHLPVSSH